MAAAAIGRQLGGVRQGNNWRAPCPLNCGYDLSLRDSDDGELLIHCFGGCGYHEIFVELIGLVGYDDIERDDTVVPEANRQERIAFARQLYGRFEPAVGTIVETYLRSRAISSTVPAILRFGIRHRFGIDYPVMAAPIVDIDGAQIGTHLTLLKRDGSGKARFDDPRHCRQTLGVVRGGTIRLAPYDPERELVLAEGIETVLSAMQLLGLPGWATSYAGNLKTELPEVVRRIVIAVDNDRAGRQSAFGAFERWNNEGRTVRCLMPHREGHDFNDVAREIARGR
jgi:hypothetical protein